MLTNQPVLYQVNLKWCLLDLCCMHASEVKQWASSASVWCHYGSGLWFYIYVSETWQRGYRGCGDIYSTQHLCLHLSLSQRWQLECVCLQTRPEKSVHETQRLQEQTGIQTHDPWGKSHEINRARPHLRGAFKSYAA